MKLSANKDNLSSATPPTDEGNIAPSRGAATSAAIRTEVKVCGFTQVGDAVTACHLGVDALGLVFYPPSGRNIDVQQAALIVKELPPFVAVTGLFLNAEKSLIEKVLDYVPLTLLQFHGTETAEFCESFKRPYIKSVAMKSVSDVHAYTQSYTQARGFLLDSNLAGAAGGSGKTFDWNKVPTDLSSPVILAGGLDCTNVAHAVTTVRPASVDISSGVESSKGVKDHVKMREFIQCVRAADSAIMQSATGVQ